jgi:hypothetical protein
VNIWTSMIFFPTFSFCFLPLFGNTIQRSFNISTIRFVNVSNFWSVKEIVLMMKAMLKFEKHGCRSSYIHLGGNKRAISNMKPNLSIILLDS